MRIKNSFLEKGALVQRTPVPGGERRAQGVQSTQSAAPSPPAPRGEGVRFCPANRLYRAGKLGDPCRRGSAASPYKGEGQFESGGFDVPEL